MIDFNEINGDKLLDWAKEQMWCKRMQVCHQNPKWHSEEDVWTHTLMVIDEIINLD